MQLLRFCANITTMELIYRNELGASYYDPQHKILVYKSNRLFANNKTELIKDLLDHTADFMHEKHVLGEIVDLSEMRGNFRRILNYLVEEYYPEMKTHGMKKSAYIISNDVIINSLVEILTNRNKTKTRAFREYEKAKTWLTS